VALAWVLVVLAWVLELDQEEKEAQGEDNPLSLAMGNTRILLMQKGRWIHRGNRNCRRNHCSILDKRQDHPPCNKLFSLICSPSGTDPSSASTAKTSGNYRTTTAGLR